MTSDASSTAGPTVIAKITAQPGKRDDLIAALRQLVDHAATEPGTLEYVLHTDRNDADVAWVYEVYASDEAFAEHGSSDVMKAVGGGLRDIAAARPELFIADVVATMPS